MPEHVKQLKGYGKKHKEIFGNSTKEDVIRIGTGSIKDQIIANLELEG